VAGGGKYVAYVHVESITAHATNAGPAGRNTKRRGIFFVESGRHRARSTGCARVFEKKMSERGGIRLSPTGFSSQNKRERGSVYEGGEQILTAK
jgi:hypothetical protein